MYQNAATAPSAPATAGTYTIETKAIAGVAGWTTTPTTPTGSDKTYVSEATIDLEGVETATVAPDWDTPYQAGSTGPTGAQGDQGDQGDQGTFLLLVFKNATSVPANPVGGIFTPNIFSLIAPDGWANNPTAPGTGESVYSARATVNPATITGTFTTPIWTVFPFALNGVTGDKGAAGAQGLFYIRVYQNSATALTTAPATAGVYTIAEKAVTGVTSWTTAPATPPTGQSTYVSEAVIDLEGVTDPTIIPDWGTPYEAGTTGATGPAGAKGDTGADGVYYIRIYQTASSVPATPTTGGYSHDTGTLNPPTGWSKTPTAATSPQKIYASEARINPASHEGLQQTTWGTPYEAGITGATGDKGDTGDTGDKGDKGDKGDTGDTGAQGLFYIRVYQNATTAPVAPATAGTYTIADKAIAGVAGWVTTPTTPTSGQNTYVSEATIDLEGVTAATVVPVWNTPYQAGATGPTGALGAQGKQGVYYLIIFKNDAIGTVPTAPTGGTVNVEANSFTAPPGWTKTPTPPTTGQAVYSARTDVFPSQAIGDITPTWYVFQFPVSGTPGPQGETGAAGVKGDGGIPGARGIPGNSGLNGSNGTDGAQGIYTIRVYKTIATAAQTAPTDGTYVISTKTLTAPTGWSTTYTAPTSDQTAYITEAEIDPAGGTDSVTPAWNTPYVAGGTGPTGAVGAKGDVGTIWYTQNAAPLIAKSSENDIWLNTTRNEAGVAITCGVVSKPGYADLAGGGVASVLSWVAESWSMNITCDT